MAREILKIKTYVDGVNDTPFPSADKQIGITEYTYTSNRMGSVSLTATLMYPKCLDDEWTGTQYVEFHGEKYFINGTPSSSKDNEDERYRHDLNFMTERDIKLNNVYFYDAVSDESSGDDKYKSNSTKVVFFGTIQEFVVRLNESLKYSGIDYTVVIDEGISSEGKLMSFEDQFFFNVLQEIYNVYNLPFYFEGKTIHIGYTSNAITKVFQYGIDNELLSIKKNNANTRIITRCSATGSSDNISFYYPNNSPKGDVEAQTGSSNTGIMQDDIVIVDSMKFVDNMKVNDVIKYNNADITIDEMTVDGSTAVDFIGINFRKDKSSSTQKTVHIDFSIPDFTGEATSSINFSVQYETISAKVVGIPYKFGAEFQHMTLWYCKNEDRNIWSVEQTLYDEGKLVKVSESKGNVNDNPFKYWASYTLDLPIKLSKSGKYRLSFDAKGWMSGAEDGSSCMMSIYVTPNEGAWIMESTGKVVDPADIGLNIIGQPAANDKITQKILSYINTSTVLLPSIYRESGGAERFYNAENDKYLIPGTDLKYEFENEYIPNAPREHIQDFPDIKPTITGITNNAGQRFDTILDVAYDNNDNDEIDDEGKYKHPYFFVKLPKYNGDYGFNLFRQSDEKSEMSLSITSGSCGACEFLIGVSDDENQANLVQVDSSGNLLRDEDGNVRCGRKGMPEESPQERQNDTINNEVWIALKKEESTYGQIMPNVTQNLRVKAGDTFVILNIIMPKSYILNAEKRLEEAAIQYMSENNSEKFNFSINFSRIYLEEHPEILAQLNENARIQILYNDRTYQLYVSQFTYKCIDDEALPEISVEITDTITVKKTVMQNTADSIMSDVNAIFAGNDFLMRGLQYFIRKDVEDSAQGKIIFRNGIEVGDYQDGNIGAGGKFGTDDDGSSRLVTDYLEVRKLARFHTLEVQETTHAGGETAFTPAGIICSRVEATDSVYRCYFETTDTSGREIYNEFVVGDQAFCRSFNDWTSRYYWRLVTAVGYNYIDLSIEDCDEGSMIPQEGDSIVQLGNRTDQNRQSAQVFSTYGEGAPSYIVYNGINSYSLADKNILGVVYNKNTNEPQFYVFGSFYVGDRDVDDPDSTFITFQQKAGDSKKQLYIKGNVSIGPNSSGLGNLSEWSDAEDSINNAQSTANSALQKAQEAQDYIDNTLPDEIAEINRKLDGVVETWFYPYTPTLSNEPAATWIKDGEQEKHIGDMFLNNQEYVDNETTPDAGKAWRWEKNTSGNYFWNQVADSDAVKALQDAAKAQDTADQKRRVFVTTPYTPYDVGDMWTAGPTGDIMRCIKARATGNYTASDWDKASKYTDDTKALEALSAVNNVNADLSALSSTVSDLDEYVDGAFRDGVINDAESIAIKKYLNTVNESWADLQASYNVVYNNSSLTGTPKTNLKNAYNTLSTRKTSLVNAINTAVSNPSSANITAVDTAFTNYNSAVGTFKNALENANKSIQDGIRNDVSDLDYLKNTFGYVVDVNGVVLGKLVAVKDDNGEVQAMMNGSTLGKDSTHGKLLIAGGISDISHPENAKTRIYEDGTIDTEKLVARGGGKIGNFNITEGIGITVYDSSSTSTTYSSSYFQLWDDGGGMIIGKEEKKGNTANSFNRTVKIIATPWGSANIGDGEGSFPSASDRLSTAMGISSIERGTGPGIVENIALLLESKGNAKAERNLAIKCLSGMFAGLRPATKYVSTDGYKLSEFEHTIIITSRTVRNIYLPDNPQNGQELLVVNAKISTLRVYPQTVSEIFSMPARADETVNTLAAYETAIYNFSAELNKWFLTVIMN